MGTNWSPVGSAQQYQGSFKYGIAARATSTGSALRVIPPPAAANAASSTRSKIRARPRPIFSPECTISCTCSHNRSTRESAFLHGYTSAASSNAPTPRRISSNSKSRDPAGINNRIASCIGATFSTSSYVPQHFEQFAIALKRSPRRKRQESRLQRKPHFAKHRNHPQKIRPRMILLNFRRAQRRRRSPLRSSQTNIPSRAISRRNPDALANVPP